MKLRIALDLDDTVFGFFSQYEQRFGQPKSDEEITKNVFSLKDNREFWTNLPLIEQPDFEPHIYATKRINSKRYTVDCIKRHGLPVKPIYQTIYQKANKADIIKGRCDVLIDDSIFNVLSCLKSGVPALLIDRPHNNHIQFEWRIYHLKYDEIQEMYNRLIEQWK